MNDDYPVSFCEQVFTLAADAIRSVRGVPDSWPRMSPYQEQLLEDIAGTIRSQRECDDAVKEGMPKSFANEWRNMFKKHQAAMEAARVQAESAATGRDDDDDATGTEKKVMAYHKDVRTFMMNRKRV